jgi:hypothetical protein
MALTRLQQAIQDVIANNPDVLIFNSDGDRATWIREIEKTFTTSGDEILAKLNRVQVSMKAFEDSVINLARPYTTNSSNSRYIPSIIDKRSKQEILASMRDVEKVLDFYLEKLGLVFKGEHLGDSSLRQQVKALIATNYLYEGSEPDSEIIFRRHHLGMFGQQISPVELINKISYGLLDEKRTYAAQTKIEWTRQEKALERIGYSSPDKLTESQTAHLNSEIAEIKDEELRSYTTKRLPVMDRDAYRAELKLRAFHQRGHPDESKMSLHEMMAVDGYISKGLEALDGFPEVPIQQTPIEWQSWPGLGDVVNDKGIFLSPERMRASELAGSPPVVETAI